MKPTIIAAGLSAVLPGAGQLYNHQWLKAGWFLAVVLVLSAIIRRREILAEPSLLAMAFVLFLFGIVLWSVTDAYRSAKIAE